MKPLCLVSILCLLLFSCSDDDDNKSKFVDKKGSIEVTLSTAHIDSARDVITSHYIIWRRNLKIKEYDVKDTVLSLGLATTEAEDNSGDTKDVVIPQDYDFFVTVK